MDKFEQILKSVEDNEIKLTDCKERNHSKISFDATYKINNHFYTFDVSFSNIEEITISSPLNKDSDLKERLEISRIAQKLIYSIKNAPMFKIKFILGNCKVYILRDKYFIYEVENFVNRIKANYIKENENKIREIIKKCLKLSKSKQTFDDTFLVIKEKDELVLRDFLIENNYMQKIVTLNNEDYLKLLVDFTCDQDVFLENFKREMESLGYNLYSDSYVSDNYYEYSDDYYWGWGYDDDEDEYEKYYTKKRS